MLEWKRLLNPVRRKSLHGSTESMNTGVGRQELERDYDRILFCTPTRRLADKTQVFPMEENTSIRNRLTHSHEVSNLARSIGVRIAFDEAERVFGDDHETLQAKRNVRHSSRRSDWPTTSAIHPLAIRARTHMRDMHMESSRRTIAGCTKARRKRIMDQNVCYVTPSRE